MVEWDIIVVGGGPAGMMAAARAAERGRRVLLLERGPSLGRKLLLTGGGRCNLTNSADSEGHIRAFGRGGGFLRRALDAFGPERLRAWLRERGLETVEETGGCVFPESGGAPAVLAVFVRALETSGCDIRVGERVASVLVEGGRAAGCRTSRGERRAGRVALATGGLSYPGTGSTGDGHDLARQAGHSVMPCYPAVVSLQTEEDWPRSVPGLALRAVALRAFSRDARGRERTLARANGDVLCTHFGLSGPAVLAVSTDVVRSLRKGDAAFLDLRLVPDMDEGRWLASLQGNRKTLRGLLAKHMPRRMAAIVCSLAGVAPSHPAAACAKQQTCDLVALLQRFRVRIAGPSAIEQAIVTGGGVCLKEVDDRTMESRLLPGLHLAGELLDLQGPTGGYNLQAAFSTGYAVGQNV